MRRVVVTRAREGASGLSSRLRALGAEPLELPTIRITPPADGGAGLAWAAADLAAGRYRWGAFTSAIAVDPLVRLLRDGRAFGSTRIAAIGPGTAAALSARSLVADLVPSRSVAEALLEAWPPAFPDRWNDPVARSEPRPAVLLPRAAVARDVLPTGLAAAGWEVDVVEAYRTEPERWSADAVRAVAAADAICFTSASTVDNFVAAAGLAAAPPVVACIGPVTAARAHEVGLSVAVVADPHTIDGLVEALASVLAHSEPLVPGT